jgi:hypothetical protein
MRRMRGGFWSFFWFGVPALAAGIAIYTYVGSKKRVPAPGDRAGAEAAQAEAEKPQGKAKGKDVASGAKPEKGKRSPASFMERFGEKFGKQWGNSDGKAPVIPVKKGRSDDEEDYAGDEALSGGYAITPGPAGRGVASSSEDGAHVAGEFCERAELRGQSPGSTKVSKKDWAKVIEQFHGAKRDLAAWVKAQDFPKPIASALEERVARLRIQRPPAQEEPDLAWRGIGAYTAGNATDGPLLRVGGGFIRRVTDDPRRARFEMTRLVAQAWAPCELEKQKLTAVWSSLLGCLGAPAEACTDGSNSEAAWAVSTSVAYAVAPANCTVPAFADAKSASCLKAWKPVTRRLASERTEPWGGSH